MYQVLVIVVVSGQNSDILTSIITKFLTSRPFGDLLPEQAGPDI